MLLELCILMLYLRTSSAAASVEMPYCETKERCDDMWEAPSISDCIDNSCECTGGSEFLELLLTCKCRDGYVVGSKGCLPAATQLGSSCEEDVQCTTLGEHVFCHAGKCHCLEEALIINGTCHKKKYPSEYCNVEEECGHVSKLVCLENKCVCDEGHFVSPDKQSCLSRLSSLLDQCDYDIQCSESFGDGSHCRRKCVCKDGFHPVNNERCVPLRKEDEMCLSTSDCYTDLTCVEGKCFRQREETTKKAAETTARRNAGNLGWTSPRFMTLSALSVSLNILMPGSRI